jgi:transcriptional regulator with XRE-family HTH domain
MTSGERIRILRILNGYSQQSLADAMGVSRASIMLWEKGKLPKRNTAMELAALFEIKVEYLLDGKNQPTCAIWQPTPPGHPNHLKAMSNDLKLGMGLLFRELNVCFAAKGVDSGEKDFWICGNSPEQSEWKVNYIINCDQSLNAIVGEAIKCSIPQPVDLGDVSSFGGKGSFIEAVADELNKIYGHYPDCQNIYDRLGGLESEGEDDFTLEGLLRRFGLVISNQDLMESDIITLSANLAKEVSISTGLNNIRGSATKFLRSALKRTKDQWGELGDN